MFFINTQHEKNYAYLIDIFSFKQRRDPAYKSSLYIAAVPAIFTCLPDLSTIGDNGSILYDLTKYEEGQEEWIVSNPRLTGSTKKMVEFGLSLYNGYPVALDEVVDAVYDEELLDVLIEAFRIRARKKESKG